jgi:high-affinity nickel-transport protein
MLLVLTQISSPWPGFLYVATFGVGSIGGMLLMSALIGLPFAFSSTKLTHFHQGLQTVAAVFSICFGIWYAYEAAIL